MKQYLKLRTSPPTQMNKSAWLMIPPDICGGCLHQISFRLVAASATLCSLQRWYDLGGSYSSWLWIPQFFTRVLCFNIERYWESFSIPEDLGCGIPNGILHMPWNPKAFGVIKNPVNHGDPQTSRCAGIKTGVSTAVFMEYGHAIPTPMEVLISYHWGCCHGGVSFGVTNM